MLDPTFLETVAVAANRAANSAGAFVIVILLPLSVLAYFTRAM